MKTILLTLRGPLRSWGAMSIGDDRWTTDRPTASAAIGLLGACAGIDRKNPALLSQWYSSWRVISASATAWRQGRRRFAPAIRSDYQTARDSLGMDGSTREHAVVSRRAYIEEGREVCALVLHDNADSALFDLAVKGLASPVYTPFLGRRSNPLSQPPADANSVQDFASVDDVVQALLDRLGQPGLMEAPVTIGAVEICADAGWLDGWRLAQATLAQPPSVVRQSVADDRMGGQRTHASRAIDVIRLDLSSRSVGSHQNTGALHASKETETEAESGVAA